ncbi:FKBP-type peptidyl-prolyl cis-trans isomerase [Janibacter cremeus]|uniref:FKBP-type peptidyl-prolyl cis-trans isomerase n=1 Tax=Janibacter cremeus TaxID=1285192 RepID=UPI0023F9724F|nr:FKBP-type peptidyl-prolyl cis-trans isomerase [Janibacter cremeus]WEV79759.1 FKBP-type peptidyl-prolyl cis-trans isomerase [Janibacter cremeus]
MPKARPRLTTAVAASLASLMLLTACGSDSESDSSGEGSSESAASAADDANESTPTLAEPKEEDLEKVEAIEVTAAEGKKGPSVELPEKPLEVSQTTRTTLEEGDGKDLADDAYATVDLAMFSAKDGKPVEGSETYTSSPIVLDLGNKQSLPGLVKAIKGQPVGTSGVAVLPPEDLFGEQGAPQLGISGKDNLVLVYDVRGELPPKAQGKKVEPKDGLPKVDWKADAPADITIPEGEEPPEDLVVEKLIKGDGETITKDDYVYVSYTGVNWKDGKVFDSSMKDGRGPFAFPVGQNAVIPGWDKAVEGAKVGDRLLVVVPPEEGYGKEGTPDGSIKGGSTLVFTVDVLGAP